MLAPQPVLDCLFIANLFGYEMSCSLVEIYKCFGGMYCFHLQGSAVANKFLPHRKMVDCSHCCENLKSHTINSVSISDYDNMFKLAALLTFTTITLLDKLRTKTKLRGLSPRANYTEITFFY